jgi:hypothetical protein
LICGEERRSTCRREAAQALTDKRRSGEIINGLWLLKYGRIVAAASASTTMGFKEYRFLQSFISVKA